MCLCQETAPSDPASATSWVIILRHTEVIIKTSKEFAGCWGRSLKCCRGFRLLSLALVESSMRCGQGIFITSIFAVVEVNPNNMKVAGRWRRA